ncbi:Retrovirus-related Pol polyprotein from transposon RE1 [Cardamine amara subsp. amara]|uniref:Retrovirus-related Pol polyprotein from transposon RE1 n=1 Tax=Cardamine amara subsp. amara TaxID=228776 RepID=A0ABD1ARW8_CARAN
MPHAQQLSTPSTVQSKNTNSHSSSSSSAAQPPTLPPPSPPAIPPPPPPSPPPNNRHRMQTRSKDGITKPNTKYTLLTSTKTKSDIEPRTTSEALEDERWRNAMGIEFNAHVKMHTWDFFPLSPEQNLVGN